MKKDKDLKHFISFSETFWQTFLPSVLSITMFRDIQKDFTFFYCRLMQNPHDSSWSFCYRSTRKKEVNYNIKFESYTKLNEKFAL